MLAETVNAMGTATVNLWLPKWETEQQVSLADTLKKLGLVDAFDAPRADFSGISDSPDQPLFLSNVLHKAYIAVDEEGTEAAAVTAIVVEAAAEKEQSEPPKPVDFRADHPFIYLIQDRHSGAVLFMGRVTDPS